MPHYWIVDPEGRQLKCYRREGSAYRPVASAGPQDAFAHQDFPGLTFQWSQLWP